MDAGGSAVPVRGGVKNGFGFTTKTIACQQSLGECLAQRRVAMGLTLAQAAAQVHVNPAYLQALESSLHEQLPGTVYAVAFVKAYARLVGLDVGEAAQRYRSELKIAQAARGETGEQWRVVARTRWWQLLVPPRVVRNAGMALVVTLCLTYLGFKVEAIVRAPLLVLTSPADELLSDHPLLTVAGQTEAGGSVTINGQEVRLDPQGRFATPLDLQPGVNLIRITARKNHSNETVVLRRVVVQAKAE